MRVTALFLLALLTFLSLSAQQQWRPMTGYGNNVGNPSWGIEGNYWKPISDWTPIFEDGVDAIPGGAAAVSELRRLTSYLYPQNQWLTADPTGVNDFLTQFAQLVYLDMTRRPQSCPANVSCRPAQAFRVNTTCDAVYDPTCAGASINFQRFVYLTGSGANTTIPRRVPYVSTAWLDLDWVYGGNAAQIAARRCNPPTNSTRLPNRKGQLFDYDEAMLSSDFAFTPTWIFGNIFTWEHNRLAVNFQAANPSWDEETLFQTARKWNIGQWQKIVTREYLSAATGGPLEPYVAYNSSLEPRVDPLIRQVAARYGHHTTADYHVLLDEDFQYTRRGIVPIEELWRGWVSSNFKQGYKDVIRGWVGTRSWDVAAFQSGNTVLRFFNSDVMAADAFRVKDLGLPLYNDARRAYGFAPIKDFSEITDSPRIINLLKNITNNNVDRLDVKWGMYAERRMPGVHLPRFLSTLLHMQFKTIRDSDRYWFEAPGMFTSDEMSQILSTTFSQVIQRAVQFKSGSDLGPNFPANPFFLPKRQPAALVQNVSYPDPDVYDNHLDLNSIYRLSWTSDNAMRATRFRIQISNVVGWVGIGWDAIEGTMENADIYLCRFLADGSVEIRDSLALDVGLPTLDTDLGGKNDAFNVSGYKSNGVSIFKFSRKWETNDTNDRSIKDVSQRVIFAYNPSTSELAYHGPSRSSANLINFRKSSTPAPTSAPTLTSTTLPAYPTQFCVPSSATTLSITLLHAFIALLFFLVI